MKLYSHRKAQIIGVFVLILIFTITLLYSEGVFDLTFIDRPASYGSLNEVDKDKLNTEDTKTEETTGNLEDEFHDIMEDMLDNLNPQETDFNPEDLLNSSFEETT